MAANPPTRTTTGGKSSRTAATVPGYSVTARCC
ncbi:hypothetical protein COLO4_00285 [Corchorus olitorius]|uniref:Uncharacterized protein n=1 Tax=Corchorus olitorius TaxID=93759 RepID=A0A1R3L473_9ROSI|nr:hypothetical protein COLO4_00285 [Corchorus olitorius]